ncbi:hypothetical protein [Sorangium sp. So ce388]
MTTGPEVADTVALEGGELGRNHEPSHKSEALLAEIAMTLRAGETR